MMAVTLLLWAAGFHLAHSQSFIRAIAAYPQLSDFTSLMINDTALAESLLDTSVIDGVQTILVPSNDAFTKYQQATGHSIESLDPSYLLTILQYHTLNMSLTSAILAEQPEIVVSTQLTNPEYNGIGGANNTNLNTNSQVVYITSTKEQNAFQIRQLGLNVSVDSGLGSIVTMDVIDGTWSGGRFQIVDR
jgi:uncharacterized surface protein with fasciclin (FAS1) repeats